MMQAFMLVGAVMALTGAAVYITGWVLAPYVYTIGADQYACTCAEFHCPASTSSADIWCTYTGTDRGFHAIYAWQ